MGERTVQGAPAVTSSEVCHWSVAWPLWNARLEAGREALAHAGDFMRRLG
jgi:hypothetical protein